MMGHNNHEKPCNGNDSLINMKYLYCSFMLNKFIFLLLKIKLVMILKIHK